MAPDDYAAIIGPEDEDDEEKITISGIDPFDDFDRHDKPGGGINISVDNITSGGNVVISGGDAPILPGVPKASGDDEDDNNNFDEEK